MHSFKRLIHQGLTGKFDHGCTVAYVLSMGLAMLGKGGGKGVVPTAYVAKIEVRYGSNLNFPSVLMGQLPVGFLLCS